MGIAVLALLVAGCGNSVTPSPSNPPSAAPSTSASALPSASAAAPTAAPSTGQPAWQPTGSMAADHPNIHTEALKDGRVLVIGEDTTAALWDPATGEWHATAGLNNPRTNFASVLLPDGRVLVAGGLNDQGQSYSSAYLFDPATESWEKSVGLMVQARTNPSAAVLPDGRVLVAGGYFHVEPSFGRVSGGIVLAAQRPVDNPGEGTPPGWADVIPGPYGSALATTEIFDPGTGQWSSTGPMHFARNGPAMAPLGDGRILVVGSLDYPNTGVEVGGGALDSAEIYDPSTGRFSLAGSFPALDLSGPKAAGLDLGSAPTISRVGQLVPLPDGGAVLIDHAGYWKRAGIATRSLRFDAASGAWSEIGDTYIEAMDPGSGEEYVSPGTPRFNPAVTPLADGRVLVAGGDGGSTGGPPSLASAVVYDPVSDSWTNLPDMPEVRSGASAVLLGDGAVLVVGGSDYASDGTPLPLRSAIILSPVGTAY